MKKFFIYFLIFIMASLVALDVALRMSPHSTEYFSLVNSQVSYEGIKMRDSGSYNMDIDAAEGVFAKLSLLDNPPDFIPFERSDLIGNENLGFTIIPESRIYITLAKFYATGERDFKKFVDMANTYYDKDPRGRYVYESEMIRWGAFNENHVEDGYIRF